ncbi:MAG: phosphatidylserine decarboxylase [Treponema sp.]|nr:phosphatidylserine decarboxylase [Treponema sp.]
MAQNSNDKSVEFLYGTKFGRGLLHIILALKFPAVMGLFLRSFLSIPVIKPFIRKNQIPMGEFAGQKYFSFNAFFTRKKEITFDSNESHFISPCDCCLSSYDITPQSYFHIKGADYSLEDFFGDDAFSQKFAGGTCLVFRLCATDYHRYCYIDSGSLEKNHFIKGKLYSVQPCALENFKVFTKNRRSWTILHTDNFGDCAQIEIGAFSVGGIKNHHENTNFVKGQEKGYFDLHGSTIVILVEKDKVKFNDEIEELRNTGTELRVKIGECIGVKK